MQHKLFNNTVNGLMFSFEMQHNVSIKRWTVKISVNKHMDNVKPTFLEMFVSTMRQLRT